MSKELANEKYDIVFDFKEPTKKELRRRARAMKKCIIGLALTSRTFRLMVEKEFPFIRAYIKKYSKKTKTRVTA
jgi:hypothetical protein